RRGTRRAVGGRCVLADGPDRSAEQAVGVVGERRRSTDDHRGIPCPYWEFASGTAEPGQSRLYDRHLGTARWAEGGAGRAPVAGELLRLPPPDAGPAAGRPDDRGALARVRRVDRRDLVRTGRRCLRLLPRRRNPPDATAVARLAAGRAD